MCSVSCTLELGVTWHKPQLPKCIPLLRFMGLADPPQRAKGMAHPFFDLVNMLIKYGLSQAQGQCPTVGTRDLLPYRYPSINWYPPDTVTHSLHDYLHPAHLSTSCLQQCHKRHALLSSGYSVLTPHPCSAILMALIKKGN